MSTNWCCPGLWLPRKPAIHTVLEYLQSWAKCGCFAAAAPGVRMLLSSFLTVPLCRQEFGIPRQHLDWKNDSTGLLAQRWRAVYSRLFEYEVLSGEAVTQRRWKEIRVSWGLFQSIHHEGHCYSHSVSCTDPWWFINARMCSLWAWYVFPS